MTKGSSLQPPWLLRSPSFESNKLEITAAAKTSCLLLLLTMSTRTRSRRSKNSSNKRAKTTAKAAPETAEEPSPPAATAPHGFGMLTLFIGQASSLLGSIDAAATQRRQKLETLTSWENYFAQKYRRVGRVAEYDAQNARQNERARHPGAPGLERTE